MNTFDTLFSRKSIRSYTGAAPTDRQLQLILKAAQAAPVGRGEYGGLHLSVIKNREFLAKVDDVTAIAWGDPGARPLYGAPVLIVVSSLLNKPPHNNVNYSNAAILVHNMSLAATELGLGSCCIWGAVAAMAGTPELVEQLGLPDGMVPCCGLIVGQTEGEFSLRDIPENRISVSFMD